MKKLHEYINNNYSKVIGWGTGSCYTKLSKELNYKLSYVIDSSPRKWGKVIDEYEIKSPDELKKENCNILIIVFSSFFKQIKNSIESYGNFFVISGEDLSEIGKLLENKNSLVLHENDKIALSISRNNYTKYVGGTCKFIAEQNKILIKNDYIHLHTFWREYRIKHFPEIIFFVVKNGIELYMFSLNELTEHLRYIDVVIIHNLIELNKKALDFLLGNINVRTKILYYIHDFSCICENIKLLYNDETFCAAYEKKWETCLNCNYKKSKDEIYSYHQRLFSKDNITLIPPSQSAKQIVDKAFDLKKNKVKVIEHQKYHLINYQMNLTEEKIRIAYVGYKLTSKGWNTFKKLYNEFKGEYDFYCLGFSDDIIDGIKYVDVSYLEDGKKAMIKKLVENRINISLLWSTWPETYSYTYFESYAAGTFIITNVMSGNIQAQVMKNHNGEVFNNYNELAYFLKDQKKVINRLRDLKHRIHKILPNEEFLQLL